MNKTILIALGGSIVVPVNGEVDVEFLKRFRSMILGFIKKGYKFVIVVGGGKTSRLYQKAATQVTKVGYDDQDWIGIYATWLNACLLKSIFKKESCPVIFDSPFKRIKKEYSKKPVIIAGGWKPGWSTDYDAVLLAKRFGAKEIIDAGNIDFVYDKDLNKYSGAKPIEKLSWKEYKKLIGSKWIPGLPAPIDPIAAKKAEEFKIKAYIVKGADLANIRNLILNKEFRGTTIY
jgi:uridylate kinase